MPTKEQLLNEYLLAAMDSGKVGMKSPKAGRGGEALMTAAENVLPFVGAAKSALEGDYRNAMIQAGLDVAMPHAVQGAAALGGKALAPLLAGIMSTKPERALEAIAKDSGLLREALEAKTPPATTPRGGRLFPQAPMYTPDVPQVDLPRMKKVDVARAAGKKPVYTERMQSLLDSPTVRKKVDRLIEKGDELGMREWYGTEPLRQAAMEAGVSPEQYRSFMAQLASASQRNPVDQQNLMGSFLYHLQQSGQLPEESMLLTNKLRKQLRSDPSLAEGKTLIELPPGYGSLAQSDIFERGRQIAGGDIEGALPPEAKLGTFYRNLLGNLRPVTVDVNAVRGPIIEQGDPRWLTSKLVEKDEEGNIKNVYFPRRMVEEGEMSVREAKQRPGFWEAAPSGSEYAGFEDLWQRAAKRHGVEPAEAQALGWYGSGDVTALKTKPELYIDNLERLIRRTAEIEGENPLQTMERILRGETFLKKKRGGSIDLERKFADGGKLAAMDTGKVEMRKAPGAKKAEKILERKKKGGKINSKAMLEQEFRHKQKG